MKGILMAIINFFKKLFSPPPTVSATPVEPTSTLTGNKYAVLVGINHYVALQGNDLQGCVNDVNNMWELLTKHYGYDPDNIRMICDDRATQQNILERLEWLVTIAKPGDELVFHYSGHGSSVRVRVEGALRPEECQCLCPTDMDWDNPLIDKTLASYFKRIQQGAFLTFVCDACHSGSMDRALQNNPHPTKARYLAPPLDIAVRALNRNLPTNRIGWKDLTGPTSEVTYIDGQFHMLMSGCKDTQTSADAYVDGKYQGAMTASLMASINDDQYTTWVALHQAMLAWLNKGGYDQIPQLSGPTNKLSGKPFGGKVA